MVLPRYSLRLLLGLMAACAVFFVCLSYALQGHTWAAMVAVPGLVLVLLAGLFLVAYSGAAAVGLLGRQFFETARPPQSPFTRSPESAAPPLVRAEAVPAGEAGPFAPPPPSETQTGNDTP